MAATVILRNKEYKIRHGMTVYSALKKLGILPESVLPTRNDELLLENDLIEEDDIIKLIEVISGG